MRLPKALCAISLRLRHLLEALKRETSGVAAVEFAMVLPVIVLMYLGMSELSQGIATDRKVTLLSRTLADLVAQSATINQTELSNTFNAAASVLAPFSGSPKMVISSVVVDGAGAAKVNWSCEKNGGTKRIKDSSVTLPTGLNAPSTSIIMAEVGLTYSPMLGDAFFKTGLELSETTYMRPRLVSSVPAPTGTGGSCNL